ncbi:recombinase family protein [Streptomyces sp. NPDC006475]|uniref:recombinase family protein n=1 Tax=Streptomyces sp. NPDC006475 TaxID=3155719 RepID=UPI0033B4390A
MTDDPPSRNTCAPQVSAAIVHVALYAVTPVCASADETLAELRSYATARGWQVADAVTDHGPLDQSTGCRPGWTLIRKAADEQRIDGIVVPAFAHIAYRWSEWDTARSWLLRRGLFVIATDPGETAEVRAGLEPEPWV